MLVKRGAESQTDSDGRSMHGPALESDEAIEARLGNLTPQDLEDFSKTDWLIICFIGTRWQLFFYVLFTLLSLNGNRLFDNQP